MCRSIVAAVGFIGTGMFCGDSFAEELTLKPTVQLTGHTEDVRVIVFSPDGKTIATGGHDQTVRLYNAATGKELKVIKGLGDRVTSLAFSADGKTLASAAYDSVRLWAVPAGTAKGVLKATIAFANVVDMSPDAKTIVIGDSENHVTVWNAATKKRTALSEGHKSFVIGISFAPKQSLIASTDQDGLLRLSDSKSGKSKKEMKLGEFPIRQVKFSPDGKKVLAGFHGKVVLVDVESGEQTTLMKEPAEESVALWFSGDGKKAMAVQDTTVRSWDVESEAMKSSAPLERLPESAGWRAGGISVDGKFAAIAIGTKTVQVVEIIEDK